MDGSKNVSLRNTQFLGKYQGVSDFLAADQGLQGVRDLSHKLGASSVVQGRQGARDVPGAQGYQGDRGNEAGNEPGAGLGGQYDVPYPYRYQYRYRKKKSFLANTDTRCFNQYHTDIS